MRIVKLYAAGAALTLAWGVGVECQRRASLPVGEHRTRGEWLHGAAVACLTWPVSVPVLTREYRKQRARNLRPTATEGPVRCCP